MEHHDGTLVERLIKFAFIIVATLYFINIFQISYPIRVTNVTTSGELAVVGEGKVEAVPDTAYVDVGITVNKVATVKEAQASLAKTNNAIVAAMTKLGIKKADVKTSNYSVYPNYVYRNEESSIDGYNGNATLAIQVNKIDLAPRIIEEATNAGANQINGTRFDIDDPSKYREEARMMAIKNAKEQARKLANELGISLGRVTNIVESSSSNSPMPYYAKGEMSAGLGGGGAPDLQAGSQTVYSTVTLYFEKN